MFKKNAWVVGLLAALAIMFVGCIDPVAEDTGGDGEETVVFQLSEMIKDATPGSLTAPADWDAVIKTKILQKCGDAAEFSIIEEGGVKKIQIDNMSATWGMGFDLYYSFAGFRAGDIVTIKGKADTDKKLMFNINTSGEVALGGWDSTQEADGTFNKTFTLSGADIGAIKGGSPQAIRIHYVTSGGNRQGKIVIEEIIIKGIRGGTAVCDCIDCDDCRCEVSCETQCAWCTPVKFDNKGVGSDYKTPTSAVANEFYLNLGDFTSDTVAGAPDATLGIPAIQYTADNVRYYYDRNDQRANFKLTTAQRDMVFDALNKGEPVNVEIDGTVSPDVNVRYGFIDTSTGSSYNASNLLQGKLSGNLKGTLTAVNAGAGKDDNAGYFTIQLREGGMKGAIAIIKSIKITTPVIQVVNITEIPLTAPVIGEIPQKSFETAQFKGAIVWDPPHANFEENQAYEATVTLTTKSSYWTFAGFTADTFTSGSYVGIVDPIASASTIDVVFNFPGIYTIDLPVDTIIKPQSGTPLADLTLNRVIISTPLTATYTKGTNGPDASLLTIRWQRDTGTAWETKGTDKTFAPADVGDWRILISTPYNTPFASGTFEVYSAVADGSKDAALNTGFARVGTKVWSFAEWIVAQGTEWVNGTEITNGGLTNSAPLANSGSYGNYNTVIQGSGLNVSGRSADGDCVSINLVAQYGTDGLTETTTFVRTKKYKVTFYGFIIGAPPADTKAVIQLDGGTYSQLSTTAVTDLEGSFKVTVDIDSTNVPATVNRLRVSTNNTAPYRLTLIEVEEID
jgi:hypothetical protein